MVNLHARCVAPAYVGEMHALVIADSLILQSSAHCVIVLHGTTIAVYCRCNWTCFTDGERRFSPISPNLNIYFSLAVVNDVIVYKAYDSH